MAVSIIVLILLINILLESGKRNSVMRKRLVKALNGNKKISPLERSKSPLTEVLSKKVDNLAKKFLPVNIIKNIEKKIITANMKGFTAATYFLLKIIILFFVLIFIPLAGLFLGFQFNFGLMMLFSIIGFVFPDLILKSKIDKRHKLIIKELPNYIDLLRICIEAGMDLDGGLNKIVEKSSGVLQEETRHAVAEVKMGKSIIDSLQDMADRINFPDFSSFITLLIQANQMGISISSILSNQSRQINLKYFQAMRARAAKIPVLILVPLVFFVLPSLLVIIMGPVIINLSNAF
jgi:tight adherence protein C